MPSKLNTRGGPDVVMGRAALEFKPLFTVVFTSRRARNLGGGEEMLRLRVYEKLQWLVKKELVNKTITNGVKEYLALPALASLLPIQPVLAKAA